MSAPRSEGDLLIVAGEASGDLHGSRLLAALQQLEPGVRAFGMGGTELASAGMELVADSAEISVVGITEVTKILRRAREIFRQLLQSVESRHTRAAVLIDFPDFNLRLAKALSKRGIPVLYYISPQIWAWRRGRVRTIRRVVDRMLVILPFEVEFYAAHGVEVDYVGHPLVDEVPLLAQAWERERTEGEPLRIALLPGSRRSEIESNLPAMLDAARRMQTSRPCHFSLIKAPSVPYSVLEPFLSGTTDDLVGVVEQRRFEAIADSHLAVCASGTATLEVGLIGTPMVVVYRVSPWTYAMGRLLVRLPNIALVNLVLGRTVVPELLQNAASPAGIAAACNGLLDDRDRILRMRAELGAVRGVLGESGASQRAARAVLTELFHRNGSDSLGTQT